MQYQSIVLTPFNILHKGTNILKISCKKSTKICFMIFLSYLAELFTNIGLYETFTIKQFN